VGGRLVPDAASRWDVIETTSGGLVGWARKRLSPGGCPGWWPEGGRGRRPGGQRTALVPYDHAPALPGHTVRRRRAVPPQGSVGEFFIFDFGDPDYFAGAGNEVPPGAKALACNLTVTSGTSGGNLRAFPGNSDVIPLVSNLNWTTGQTVANYAIVAAATPADGTEFMASVGLHNASTRGSVHVIVDISGSFV